MLSDNHTWMHPLLNIVSICRVLTYSLRKSCFEWNYLLGEFFNCLTQMGKFAIGEHVNRKFCRFILKSFKFEHQKASNFAQLGRNWCHITTASCPCALTVIDR